MSSRVIIKHMLISEEGGKAYRTQNIYTEIRLNIFITREQNMWAFCCEKWKYKYPTYKTTQGSVLRKISATIQRTIVTDCYIRLRWICPPSYTAEKTTRNEVVHWEVLATKCSGDIRANWHPLCRPFINTLFFITG